MTKTKKHIQMRVVNIFLTAILLIGMVPMAAFAETTDNYYTFALISQPVEYYGRTALGNLANAAALQYAYDRIVSGIASSAETIVVSNSTNKLTVEELKTVFDAYRRDHTEHFWLGNAYSYSFDSVNGTVIGLKPTYTMSGDKLTQAKTAFNQAVNAYLAGITSDMSEFKIEKELHDRMAASISYEETDNAHNAYGALVEGKAVCEGYAEAYQFLLQCAGLQSFIVTGSSMNPATGIPEVHAWNMVRVDGRYYHVDLTWDDQGERLFYAYFNKTDARIKEDHTIDATVYTLPVCNSEVADYFSVNGGNLPAFDLDAVAALLTSGGGTARVYVTGDKNAFIAAFNANFAALAQKLGLTGSISGGYANLSRELILMVGLTGVTVSGTATSFNSSTDDVTIQLIESGASEAAYETIVKGNTASYSIAGVAPGTYTMKVMKQNHVTREYTVTVGAENVTQDVEIWLLGDVNGDGTINVKDKKLIFNHLNDPSGALTGYALDVGDVNRDGTINVKDKKLIFNHLKGTSLWS